MLTSVTLFKLQSLTSQEQQYRQSTQPEKGKPTLTHLIVSSWQTLLSPLSPSSTFSNTVNETSVGQVRTRVVLGRLPSTEKVGPNIYSILIIQSLKLFTRLYKD
jgi:hypothetical protein